MSQPIDDLETNTEKETESIKEVVGLSDEEVWVLKNYNLQIILADKNIENLQLRHTIMTHEKSAVVREMVEYKNLIQLKNGINISDYSIDLTKKVLVHKNSLKK